jgi:2-hydroxy-3-oxopropionate reductase
VIGLGVMGAPMARNLLAEGLEVTVHSRSPGPVAALGTAGAAVAQTPRAVARACDVVVITVPDTPDLAVVMGGPDGVLAGAHEGLVVVDCGSHDPTAMPGHAAALREVGADFLDAPLSGGEAGAIAGTLSIMVGGRAETLERARPALQAVGSTIVHMGDVGAGQVAKAANQLVVAAALQALAEAVVLARSSGIDPARLIEALGGGLAASRVLDLAGPRMLAGDYAPGGRARFHLKDLRNARAAADARGVILPTLDLVTDAFERLVEAGRGDLDHAAVLTLLDQAG